MSRATPLKPVNRTIRIKPAHWQAVIEHLGITNADAQRGRLRERLLRGLRILAAPIPSPGQQVAFVRKIRAVRQADQKLLLRTSTFDLGLLLDCGYPPELLNQELCSQGRAACIEADRRLSKLSGKRRDSVHHGWLKGVREISHTLHDHYRGRESMRSSAVRECILTLVLHSGAIGAIGTHEKTHNTFREQLPRLLQESGGFGHGPHSHALNSIANRINRERDKLAAYNDEVVQYAQKHPEWRKSITEASAETMDAARAIVEEHERKQENAIRGKI